MKYRQIKEMPNWCGANQATNGKVIRCGTNERGSTRFWQRIIEYVRDIPMEINRRKYRQYVRANKLKSQSRMYEVEQ